MGKFGPAVCRSISSMLRKPLKKNFIIGITGQLATGKTTVATMFSEEAGAQVINADLLAHRALRNQGACFKKVVKAFGADILHEGQIDRKKLAAIVFASPAKLKKLESILHPFVIRETRRHISLIKKAGPKVIVLDVPLLFESGMDKLADLTIAVKAGKQIQLARCLRQGLSRSEAEKRMRFQWPMAENIRRADMIIDNGGTAAQTRKQIKKIWEVLQRRYFKI